MPTARSASRAVWCLGMLALTIPVAAWPGMFDSFQDRGQSKIDYSQAAARPVVMCEQLRHQTTPGYTIIATRRVSATAEAPEHCELHGVISPEVQFWLYLPTQWNGRFYMVGHGGYAGLAPRDAPPFLLRIQAGVRNGFATVFTNTGHDAAYEPLGTFAYNEIQKTLDYAYRAVHLTAVTGKALADTYYGRRAQFAYFDGCSTGGRQGLMEAQRFPEDFDGIVAGAPVNAFTDLHIWMAWIYQALEKTPISAKRVTDILAPAVLKACDSLDGAKDGLIQNPARCPFNPATDLPICDSGGDACFSPAELATLKRLYGPVMSRGKPYFPGLQVGVEPPGVLNERVLHWLGRKDDPVGSGWLTYIIDDKGGLGRMESFADTFFKYFVFGKDDPNYDWRRLDFDNDLAKMGAVRSMLDAVDADMSAFKARGGKIISYHGWADGGPPAAFTVKYYEDVLARMGERETRDFYRLFMVPGMFHCDDGFGPNRFDAMTALINWVEGGAIPDSIHAEQISDGKVVRSRPLCPYPQISRYKGSGDVNLANSFICSAR